MTLKTASPTCPFCAKPLKDGRACARAACQAKAAVWASKRGR